MKNPHRFYGLKDLETDDIGFAWNCPKAERSGCLGYELRRQMGARVIAEKYPNLLGVPLVEITKVWLAEFARPWRTSRRRPQPRLAGGDLLGQDRLGLE